MKANSQFQPNESGIALKISEHFTKEENYMKHIVYVIKGFDGQGPIEISRRYSEFAMIREVLVIRWPGCFIPPLPPKDIMQKVQMQEPFIQERRAALDLFLRKMSEVPVLYNSQEFQVFLRFPGSNFISQIKPMKRIVFEEMLSRYASNFQHLANIPSKDEARIIISRFRSFLAKMQGRLNIMKNHSKEIVRAKRSFYHGMGTFQTEVASVYEKEVLAEYENNENIPTIFSQENNPALEAQAKRMKEAVQNPSLELFDSWLRVEIRELNALSEAIQQMDKYEAYRIKAEAKVKSYMERKNKLATGEFDWRNLLTTKPKDAQIFYLEEMATKTQNDIKNLALLGDMIVLILAYDGIQKFKTNKAEKFYAFVSNAVQNELNNLGTVRRILYRI